MAKVTNPLYSFEATGPIADAKRYLKSRGIHIVKSRQSRTAAMGIMERRQATIVSEGARLWRERNGAGPEPNYQQYVGGLSRNSWFFVTDAILLEWSKDQLMPL